ncbi:MAG: transcriptional regulator, AsnC family [Caulobacter sp.]|nr:transcriptional regulator, AsnC family [Caulobacter sp.]
MSRQERGRFGPIRGNKSLSEPLDAVDAKILDLIQHDAGLSVAEIAERVGLSSSPCWRRIKRLEDAGVIQRRVTILDRELLGLAFEGDFLRDKILSLGLVSNIESRIVIRGVKNSTAVPLGLVSPYVSPHG